MRRLTRDNKIFEFSKDNKPVMEVDPGESILVETTDSFDAQFDRSSLRRFDAGTSKEDTSIDLKRALPHTGPIFVNGAEPGDILTVNLIRILPVSNGFISCLPGFSRLLLGTKVPEDERWTVRITEFHPGLIKFNEDVDYPYRLMVGSLGVAPDGKPVKTDTPGEFGGNHDCYLFTDNATLYLPVFVPGALVSLGDVHGAMADGEGAGTANECDAEVTLRFGVLKGMAHLAHFPVLETGDHWMAYGWGEETDAALASAQDNAISILQRELGLDYADCYMLMAAACHLRINELVNPNRSARVEIPKYLIASIF